MTAIAIWFNNEMSENPSLWVASDSRVSNNKNSTLIDDAAKVFALPVVCRFPGEDGFFSQIGYFHTYGYCFAGSTLLGQNTFLALMPLLSNLATVQPYIPQMADVADFILQYLGRAFDDYKVIACEHSGVEVALFGWCHVTQKQHIFHYYPVKDDNEYVLKCTDYTDLNEKSFVYLGEDRKDMTQKIQKAFNGDSEPGRPLSRIPRYIIEEHIQNSEYKTIGGNLQLAIADRFGFRPFSICKPRAIGKPEAYLSYLGYELHQDIKNVGDAIVNLPGMV
ncbi:hypothetical protein [Nostoc sp.]|uniref:hypothetical protein n=1 Tax=Nostoc sp. TaxID=1180 RepID=UPI002FF6F1F1